AVVVVVGLFLRRDLGVLRTIRQVWVSGVEREEPGAPAGRVRGSARAQPCLKGGAGTRGIVSCGALQIRTRHGLAVTSWIISRPHLSADLQPREEQARGIGGLWGEAKPAPQGERPSGGCEPSELDLLGTLS